MHLHVKLLSLVLLFGAPAWADTAWALHERQEVEVSSERGATAIGYSLSVPQGWAAESRGGSERIAPPEDSGTGFMVLALHTGDAGVEQLLNEEEGLRKWVARAQPSLRLSRTETTPGRRQLLHLEGERGGTRLFYLVSLVRVGDANVVLIGFAPASQRASLEPVLRRMHQSFLAG